MTEAGLSSHGPSEVGCLGLLAPSSGPFHFGSLLSGSNFGLLLTYAWWVGDVRIKYPLENGWRPSLSFGILTARLWGFAEQREIYLYSKRSWQRASCSSAPVWWVNAELCLPRVFLFATFVDSEFTLEHMYDNTRDLIYCSDFLSVYSSIEMM